MILRQSYPGQPVYFIDLGGPLDHSVHRWFHKYGEVE